MNTLAIGMPGGPELMIIMFVILLLFGAKKLPELSRSLGKSLSEFKKGQREGAESEHTEGDQNKIEQKDAEKKEISASNDTEKKAD